MSKYRIVPVVLASAFAFLIAGCGSDLASLVAGPAALTQDGTTVRVAAPLPESEFAAGDDVEFAIEVFSADKSDAAGHPGPGGHYHVYLDSKESVVFQSAVPSFKYALPTSLSKGAHTFYVQYHAADGKTDMFELNVPIRIR